MPADPQHVHDSLQRAFPQCALDQDEIDAKEEETEKRTIFTLRKGWTSGVDIWIEGSTASVEWATKIGALMLFVVHGITFVLTFSFGERILRGTGLLADAGTISFPEYIFPFILFWIPLLLLSSIAQKLLVRRQESLLVRARKVLKGAGFTIKTLENR